MISPFALPFVFGGLVVADDATGAGSEQTVVADEMPGYPTYDCPLQATFGRRGDRTRHNRSHRDGKSRGDHGRSHPGLLEAVLVSWSQRSSRNQRSRQSNRDPTRKQMCQFMTNVKQDNHFLT
jgi:hypothetical protein